jgi:predicted PurR-regulated permease PerM
VHEWWLSYVLVACLTGLAAAALIGVLAQVLRPVQHILLLLVLAVVVAFALSPVVALVERRARGRHGLAVATVVLVSAALWVGTIVLFLIPLVGQLETVTSAAPALLDRLQRGEDLTVGSVTVSREVMARVGPLAGQLLARSGEGSVGFALGAVQAVTDAVIVLVMSLYLLIDGSRFRASALRAISPRHRPRLRAVENEVVRVFGGYLRGQLILAGTVGVLVSIVLAALGVPYALALGAFAAVAELIPMFGPVIAAIPAIGIALLQPFPTVVWVAIAFVLIQQFESNVLAPRVTGHAVGLHPLGAVIALLAGFHVAGIVGALFAVPVAGLLAVLVSSALTASRGGHVRARAPRSLVGGRAERRRARTETGPARP